MFIVLLKFSENKSQAGEFMDEHNAWIKQNFDAGVFLLVGSIEPSSGGAIMAHNIALRELENTVQQDPFVIHNVVKAEIIEISPKKADTRLDFLVD